MPAVKFSPFGNSQFVTTAGAPANAYKLYAYAAGSSTPQTTYTDATGTVAQSNPIILNSLGLPTNGQIWLTAGLVYKLVWTDASDVVLKTEDNISGVNDSSVSVSQWIASGATPTYVSASSFTLAGDQTSAFHVGRRLQFTTTAGTVYGLISASVFTTLTTVTVVMDTGVLDSGLSAVNLAVLTAVNPSLPNSPAVRTALGVPGLTSNTFSGLQVFAAGAAIASAATINLSTATGNTVHITGTVATSAVTMTAGQWMWLIADAAWPLTYNATTNKLNSNGASVTLAAGDRVFYYCDGTTVFGNIVKLDGTTLTGGITSATKQATTSGTSKDFTGIPATAKRITVQLSAVSTNGTSLIQVQLGTLAGGIETTGYASTASSNGSSSSSTTGLLCSYRADAAQILRGAIVITLMDAATNLWVMQGNCTSQAAIDTSSTAGDKTLSGVLDRIRLTTINGTDAFDAGAVNILYE